MRPHRYRIVVFGRLGQLTREVFEDLCLEFDGANTGLTGEGSPYLTGVSLARFPCRDSLEGPDRYGVWLLPVTAAGNGADEPAGDDRAGM